VRAAPGRPPWLSKNYLRPVRHHRNDLWGYRKQSLITATVGLFSLPRGRRPERLRLDFHNNPHILLRFSVLIFVALHLALLFHPPSQISRAVTAWMAVLNAASILTPVPDEPAFERAGPCGAAAEPV
jgi:hypothetical protein